MPGLTTPTEAAKKRKIVEAAAAEAGRTIDPEHFGVNLTYSRARLPDVAAEQLSRRRPGIDLDDLIPQSRAALHDRVDEWRFSCDLPRTGERPDFTRLWSGLSQFGSTCCMESEG
jgi:hypothetical protein